MQLITGGMGFVGRHTAKALLDLGETCVLTSSQPSRGPRFITDEIGKRLFVEPGDLTDPAALLSIGKRHTITGIIHLAGVGSLRPESYRANIDAFLNVLHAAQEWKVSRVSFASTIGVYAGAQAAGPCAEDLPLPLAAFHPIPTLKKIMELIGSQVGASAGISVVGFRFGAWGPLFHHPPSPMNIPSQMVRAAVNGETLDFSLPQSRAFAEDGADLSYVKDCGRAVAMLQLARTLNHAVYNIGCGRAASNRELAVAIRRVIPGARFALPEGFDPRGPGRLFELDIARIRADTGFVPEYDVEKGVADYVSWLRAGNRE
jgi:UDP-glucose 4-epimerase